MFWVCLSLFVRLCFSLFMLPCMFVCLCNCSIFLLCPWRHLLTSIPLWGCVLGLSMFVCLFVCAFLFLCFPVCLFLFVIARMFDCVPYDEKMGQFSQIISYIFRPHCVKLGQLHFEPTTAHVPLKCAQVWLLFSVHGCICLLNIVHPSLVPQPTCCWTFSKSYGDPV